MVNDASKIFNGKPVASGGILIAPKGTAGPTDTSTALDPAFVAAGYAGEDGLTETTDRSTEKVRAWGGDTVRVLQTDFSVTYSFVFLESHNTTVLETVYGDDNVTAVPPTASTGSLHTVKINADTLPNKAFVFDMKDGDRKIRIHVPDGQVTEVGEVTYNDGELVGYEVTIEAFKDNVLGANAIKYLDDGKFSAV